MRFTKMGIIVICKGYDNMQSRLLSLLQKVYSRLYYHHHKLVIAEDVTINGRIHIYGKGNFYIGEGPIINSGKNHNPIGGDIRTVFYKWGW